MSIISEREFLQIGRCRDINGQKFGRLTAIGLVETHPRRGAKWLFHCDCGQEKEMFATAAKRNQNCGCKRACGITQGQRNGMLTAIESAGKSLEGRALWLFACDCGNKKVIKALSFTTGNTKSCGCNQYKSSGLIKSKRLYHIWMGMKSRCLNPKNPDYANYGGRGIRICEEWAGKRDYPVFQSWAFSNGYNDSLSIDRVDNNLGYSPCNCRWATPEEQASNRRCSSNILAWGETKTIAQWSRDSRALVTGRTIGERIKNGMGAEDAIGLPSRIL